MKLLKSNKSRKKINVNYASKSELKILSLLINEWVKIWVGTRWSPNHKKRNDQMSTRRYLFTQVTNTAIGLQVTYVCFLDSIFICTILLSKLTTMTVLRELDFELLICNHFFFNAEYRIVWVCERHRLKAIQVVVDDIFIDDFDTSSTVTARLTISSSGGACVNLTANWLQFWVFCDSIEHASIFVWFFCCYFSCAFSNNARTFTTIYRRLTMLKFE